MISGGSIFNDHGGSFLDCHYDTVVEPAKKTISAIKAFTPSAKKKDYGENSFISAKWKDCEELSQNAYRVIILGYGAPGVDTVLHQGFFDVVLPRLAGALFPRRRDGLRGVYPAKNGGVQCRGRGQRNNHQTIDMRRGVRFAGGSSCRRVWL